MPSTKDFGRGFEQLLEKHPEYIPYARAFILLYFLLVALLLLGIIK